MEGWKVGLVFGALPRTPARGNAPCTQASPKGDAFFCPCALAPQKEHSTETHTFAHGSAMQHFCHAPLFDPCQKKRRAARKAIPLGFLPFSPPQGVCKFGLPAVLGGPSVRWGGAGRGEAPLHRHTRTRAAPGTAPNHTYTRKLHTHCLRHTLRMAL